MPSLTQASHEFDYVQAIEGLLEDAKKLAAITSGAADETKLRRKISMTAKKIAFEVGDPADIVKSKWVELADVGAANLFIDWKVFDHIPVDDPAGISVQALAEAVGAEQSVLERISNLLISTSTLQRGTSTTPTNLHITHGRLSPLYKSTHPFSPLVTVATGNGMRPYSQWPSYFQTYGRQEPQKISHTPFSYSWGHADLEPWAVKALHPEYARQFERSMQSRDMVGYLKLVGPEALYDFSWVGRVAARQKETARSLGWATRRNNSNNNKNNNIAANEKQNSPGLWNNSTPVLSPVVVDVGGGLGQLIHDVVREIPGIDPSQCVLQDRKEVIEAAVTRIQSDSELQVAGLKEIITMEHDFHQPQPIKGATVYFLRRILLDYPDSLAIGILKQLADALPVPVPGERNGADQARVFIMEPRLLDTPIAMNRIVDMVMLNIGGKLRNEKMYRDLATAAGLKVVGYYTRETDPAVVVECARA